MRVTLGPEDNGREVWVLVGDIMALRLPENPTTGVRWMIDEESTSFEVTADGYQPADTGNENEWREPGIGAAATRVLTFTMREPGRVELRLRRLQVWEGDSTTDATFAITCHIGGTNLA